MRWTEADEETFRKLRKNYNAKIERIKKSDPEMVKFLPKKLRKEDIYSRKDFNTAQKYGELFLRKGSNKIVRIEPNDPRKVPAYFKDQLNYLTRKENARRRSEQGKFTGEKGNQSLKQKADMRKLKAAPKGRQSKPEKRLEELASYKNALENIHLYDEFKVQRSIVFRQKYIDKLKQVVSDAVRIEPTISYLVQPIEELLRSADPIKIGVAYKEFSYLLTIDYLYDIQDAAPETFALYVNWCNYLGVTPRQIYLDRYEQIMDGGSIYEKGIS